MGEGKTEAALYVSHALRARGMHGGTYIGLPTQATANQMFDRLSAFLAATREDGERVGLMLLHGEAVTTDARTLVEYANFGSAIGNRAGCGSYPYSLHIRK